VAADALSRSFFAISGPINPLISLIEAAVNEDPHSSSIKNKCLGNSCDDQLFSVHNGLLYWKQRIMVPPKPQLIQAIL
jgi:hypothetical protein